MFQFHADQRGRFGFEEWQTTRAVNTLRDARYGLRGVRVGETSRPGPPKPSIRLGEEPSWSEVPPTVPATLGAPQRGTAVCQKESFHVRVVGSGIAPTVVDTPVDVHRANRFSPFTAEIDGEPVLGVPELSHQSTRWVSLTQTASSFMQSTPQEPVMGLRVRTLSPSNDPMILPTQYWTKFQSFEPPERVSLVWTVWI